MAKRVLLGNFTGFKVWGDIKEGEYQVRLGNKIIARHLTLYGALKDAEKRADDWWDEQARQLKIMQLDMQLAEKEKV